MRKSDCPGPMRPYIKYWLLEKGWRGGGGGGKIIAKGSNRDFRVSYTFKLHLDNQTEIKGLYATFGKTFLSSLRKQTEKLNTWARVSAIVYKSLCLP